MKTLGELVECFSLYAVCEPCERMEAVNVGALITSEGDDYPIDRVRMRLRCQRCNHRTQAVRIVYIGPGGRAATFRYAR